MPTVRERICGAGVSTLRQFLCLDVGVGGGITYTGEIISVGEERAVQLLEINTSVPISEIESVNIAEVDIMVQIISIKEDTIDGVC